MPVIAAFVHCDRTIELQLTAWIIHEIELKLVFISASCLLRLVTCQHQAPGRGTGTLQNSPLSACASGFFSFTKN
jgi:hypothetical protein